MYETALKVLKEFTNRNFKAYIVGGYPRDRYLERKSIDIDICTSATPVEIKGIFKNLMLPNEQYGSVTVIYNKVRFEITTFRKEQKYENNRTPVNVIYIDSLIEDLNRRDFIINTLCIDSEGNLLDMIGAKKDLDNKIIRCVGDADLRIAEDILRALRAIRFATILNFELDESLKKSIKKNHQLLKKLSYYRKKEELSKIFASENVLYGISLLMELDLLKVLELEKLSSVVVTRDILGIWAQLEVIDKYPFNRHEKEIISKVCSLLKKDEIEDYDLYMNGLYVTTLASEIKSENRFNLIDRYNNLPIHSKKEIAIKYDEIINIIGEDNKNLIKTILYDVEKLIINQKIKNNKTDLVEYVQNNFNTILNNKNKV